MRVHELAKELDLNSKDVIKILKDNKITVKGHMSSVSDEGIKLVRDSVAKASSGKAPAQKKKQPHAVEAAKKPEKKPEKKKEKEKEKENVVSVEPPQADEKEKKPSKVLELDLPISVKSLAQKINTKPNELIAKLMTMGVFASLNQMLDAETAEIVVHEYGYDLAKKESKKIEPIEIIEEKKSTFEEELLEKVEDKPEDLKPRPPVVTFLGHVDHGKTTLLDYIRKTKVVSKEHGGITQHIGAYRVNSSHGSIAFLDTPGHEAFTAMRARGANVTDIAVLIIAADDGIMPQTVEAINHSKAAGVAIMVAITKVDKPTANVERVKRQLAELNLVPEDWGGEIICCEVSGITGEGVEHFLEMISLQAEILELKANPDRLAEGTVIEAKMTRDRGPIVVVLVRKGTLKRGDIIISGMYFGKVKALIDEHGKSLNSAGPSVPVEILGLLGVPDAGSEFRVVSSEKTARSIAEHRQEKYKGELLDKRQKVTLENLYDRIKQGASRELRIVLKCDVQGSIEAIIKSLQAIDSQEVVLNIIHNGLGDINDSDIMLASASNGIVIGFHVRTTPGIKDLAKTQGVEIRNYKIIYDLINEIRLGLEGLLEPEQKEVVTGHAEVRQVFKISKIGNIAGCHMLDGYINRSSFVRVQRDGEAIFEGKIDSLKRFKDEVKEVKTGFECGISIAGFKDFSEGDIIESYIIEKKIRKL
ncbi:MAG: translation initiation factor IF-2 [Candidatus Aureabacteria bacterium]|nr:translation initiation factor IF-2 [Candidatus Auribacterota bacterium]